MLVAGLLAARGDAQAPADPQTSACRTDSATGLPHRHQLRPRRRHRHRQERQPGRRSQAERLRGHRGRQAADDRNLQARQARRRRDADRRRPAARRSAPTPTKSSKRRATTCGCSRSSWTTITCAAASSIVACASRSSRFVETQLGPSDMVGLMYPLEPLVVAAHDAQSRRDQQGHSAVPGPQVRLHAEEPVRRGVRVLSDRGRREDPQPGVAVGDQGAHHRTWARSRKAARR